VGPSERHYLPYQSRTLEVTLLASKPPVFVVTHAAVGAVGESASRAGEDHDLRHACASLLLVQGVHPRVVLETLGHSQISLTMNTYSRALPALQREAADRMEAALAPGVPAG
jgi:integrase